MMQIVFMGTPDFAVPSLERLAARYPVVGVVTQPDRPAGRGKALTAPPVKVAAERLGLPLIQPGRLREPEAMAQLTAWAPDLVVVAAFGQILRAAVLDLPHHGCLNVHASLLPRHRGAAPIAAAILAGDAQTGITIMKMDVGLDTGPLVSQRGIPILATDTSGSLAARLAQVGAELLLETLPRYLDGDALPQAQDEQLATYAPQLKKEDGRLDFARSAAVLARQVRALAPWPGAYCEWQAQPLRVWEAVATAASGEIGRVLDTAQGPVVVCGEGGLLLRQVQPAGRKPMSAGDFARGARSFVGSQLA